MDAIGIFLPILQVTLLVFKTWDMQVLQSIVVDPVQNIQQNDVSAFISYRLVAFVKFMGFNFNDGY